ncbi:hypothetical protein CO115_04910 [Candidatus Falkowbacteria bacterium CG_4_9_14_3_um_filter_36_9]|uniref:Radical SAM core domain-containing protein n=2 Tax=Candidatus Falkowiibacteriota TaxID=1752728 RepID=A0A2M7DNT8_9BACT|nr:MAG: hypothetical protein COS18_02800 [Candidatus Falkowbacteria bacterium CG02_land_8_20_14_3_00_36_14]PIX11034.1 MAG: hypothetical protein COZ73_03710 [Candidatus Falkowbacteria bacterium CG_4_8_14_3_um_filter_36_11]PJA10447.1 MAG: hypothetical protein COX67_04600 [Candidatus Falkowbacteria bacterium CG_4_10_14_0_2_um_filter_36_22]PJB18211.1 MAG: hypothetical protein CO115_04910 [Candidatus Falkowbacteria bacterium CG_4_9_14_3_um_filter_36_9]
MHEQPLIETEKNSSIRLKVTNRCPWECTFCHKEGSWDIDDIRWNQATEDNMKKLTGALNLKEVHFSGGEPSSNSRLEEISEGLSSMGLEVKTTSNAQFSELRFKKLIDSGIKSFNFSIHALTPENFIKTQNKKDLYWAKKCIEKQKKIIARAKELNINIKLNTVISTEDDIERAKEIYDFAKKNNISVRFLNDLGNGQISIVALKKISEDILQAEKFKEKIVTGSSSKTSYYKDKDGFEFGIKEIRNNKLKTLCEGCKESCTEQFYGIRLEQKDGKFYVRLCIDRKDEKSYMPLEEFLESNQLKEINNLLNE